MISIFALANVMVCAQSNDPVLMTVGKENVTKSEFIKAYQKKYCQCRRDMPSHLFHVKQTNHQLKTE